MILTSYFANWRKFKDIDKRLISIANYPPKHGIYEEAPELFPDKEDVFKLKEGVLSKELFIQYIIVHR